MDWDNPSFIREIALTYELEILPGDAADTVRLVNDPTLAAEFKRAISVKVFDKPLGRAAEPGEFYLEIAVTRDVPMNAAFLIIGRVGEREAILGDFTVKKPGRGNRMRRSCDVELIGADHFTPILRADAEAARRTADIFEIWDGELEFAPVQMPSSDD